MSTRLTEDEQALNPLGPAIADFQRYLRLRAERRAQVPSRGKQLIQAVAESLAGCTEASLPVNLHRAARQLHATIELLEKSSTAQLGKLAPVRGGFRVTVYVDEQRPGPGEGFFDQEGDNIGKLTNRSRFTLAHELGHALFFSLPQDETEKPERIIPVTESRAMRWREEGLCHDFARALLMPTAAKRTLGVDPSPHAIVEGTRAFGVSREALVRRVLHDWLLWQDTSFFHLSIGARARAQFLHGRGVRRRSTVSERRSRQLQEIVSRAKSPDLLSTIERVFGSSRDQMLVSSKEVWAILP